MILTSRPASLTTGILLIPFAVIKRIVSGTGALFDRDEGPKQHSANLDEVRIEARRDDFDDDVPVGHDADRLPPFVRHVDHDDIADMIVPHQMCGLDDRGVMDCAHDVSIAELADAQVFRRSGSGDEPPRRIPEQQPRRSRRPGIRFR